MPRIEPRFDAQGGPSPAFLDEIREHVGPAHEVLQAVMDAWNMRHGEKEERSIGLRKADDRVREVELRTGMHPDNVDLINAFGDNTPAWAVCFKAAADDGKWLFNDVRPREHRIGGGTVTWRPE